MSPALKKIPDYTHYADSYVAAALIDDCRKSGLFELLKSGGRTPASSLANTLSCDENWLAAALRILESIAWISRDDRDSLRLTGNANAAGIPDDIGLLFTRPAESFVEDDASQALLTGWFERAVPGCDQSALLDNALLLPVIHSMRKSVVRGVSPFSDLSQPLLEAATPFLREQGWVRADHDSFSLTTEGLRLLDQVDDTFNIAACSILDADVSSVEIPENAVQFVLDQLNSLPVSDRPQYLVCLGSAAECFREQLHTRMAACEAGQLAPIIVVIEEFERIETSLSAHGFTGSISDASISDTSKLLFINCSTRFPHRSPTSTECAREQRLEQWSRLLGPHGAIFLDLCFVPPSVADRAHHSFASTRALISRHFVTPDDFLLMAARQRLFAKVQPVLSSSQTASPQVILCAYFERRDYRIRNAEISDLKSLEELEEHCWALGLRTPSEALASRLRTYPEGQFVLDLDQQVVGVIYSQRIDSTDSLRGVTAQDVLSLHRADGPVAQLVAVNISPKQQQHNFGDQLLEFMLQRCRFTPGVDSVAAVTLCRDYYKQSDIPLPEYITRRNQFGTLVDPILRFHELHGACVAGLIPGYRPADDRNQGNGVLVCYDIHRRKREEIPAGGVAASVPVHALAPNRSDALQQIVESLVKGRLNGNGDTAYSPVRPLMEMGLDSADLMTLNDAVRGRFGLKLDTAFFFRHNTPEKIVAYLREHTSPLSEVATVDAPAQTAPRLQSDEPPAAAASADIAIIGMACRLPGNICTPDDLWRLLQAQKSAIGPAPASRWQSPAWNEAAGRYPGIDRGGFVESVDCFDAEMFRISPREAQWMDPQQRLLLELSWEALEEAGYGAGQLFDSDTAVYVGASGSDYRLLLNQRSLEVDPYLGTGNSMAVLANRISYFYGFRGPSLTIDTACSSSLVALHHAVRSLQRGEAAQALVAGVNVICDPSISLSYYKAGMLSPDGLCRTFDEKANGYVRSEGAILLLIKPLAAAVRDQDPIHAVIKGTACNHGGQAAGLTVPNPKQQAALLLDAWQASGVAPETLGYIEVHGSATRLGDTIEAEGLKEAFRPIAARNPHDRTVALGSVKSNLGHLEAAAGLAGLLKTVLCLKNRQFVASINFKRLNPKIDFSDSVFYVSTQNQPWVLPEGTSRRRAGVSSFGSGGGNAHAVLEEYVVEACMSAAPAAADSSGPFSISLSARNEERLRAWASRLLDYLNDKDEREISWASIACTLERRQVMEESAVLQVCSVNELKSALQSLVQGKPLAGSYRRSTGTPPKEHVDHDDLRRRIHLPPYPFARTRHWITAERNEIPPSGELRVGPLHSFVREQTAGSTQQRFHWRFTGEEPVFRDHVVGRERVLPAVAYLEMVRAAVVDTSTPNNSPESNGVRLTNVVWLRPLVAGTHAFDLRVQMEPRPEGGFRYEASSFRESEPVVHSQGVAGRTSLKELPAVNIPELRSAMTMAEVSHNQCYDKLAVLGFDYGPTHRGVETIYLGRGQSLVRLRSADIETSRIPLHPTLMDAALQAALFSLVSDTEAGVPAPVPQLPFALHKLELITECGNARWAWIRPSTPKRPSTEEPRFDIDLCDDAGRICVQLTGLAFRALTRQVHENGSSGLANSEPPAPVMFMHPTWDVIVHPQSAISPDVNAHLVVIGESPAQHDSIREIYPHVDFVESGMDSIDELKDKLGSIARLDHLVWIALDSPLESVSADITTGQSGGILQVFRLVKALHLLGYGRKEISWTLITTQTQAVHPSDSVNPVHAAIHGFVGSMAKEHPHWKIRLLDMEHSSSWSAREMFALPFDSEGNAVAYRRGEWLRRVLLPVSDIASGPAPWREQGVYVVIGGAGGLGEVWSRMMILRHRASVIWIGRRELDSAISSKIAALAVLGHAPSYIQADATDLESLRNAYKTIKLKHPRIHGVVHSAIVLRDESLINMNEERFRTGLASKLDVSVRIAQVFAAEPLDLVLFFSSVLAFEKPPGQSNYAAGCAFSDSFAARMSREWNCDVRVLNWGYWGSTGAVASAAYNERMARRGFTSIEPEQGMAAMEKALGSPMRQLAIVAGTPTGLQSQVKQSDRLTVYPAASPGCFEPFAASVITQVPRTPLEQLTGGLQTPSGLEPFLLKLMLGSIQTLVPSAKSTVTLARLKAAVSGPAFFVRWLEESIVLLRKAGLLRFDENRSIIDWDRIELDSLWPQWSRFTQGNGDSLNPAVAMLDACLRALPMVLTGRQLATDLLFAGSNARLLESVYRGNPASDFFNSVAHSAVVAWIEERLSQEPAARIRLIEIGAGTGGTTAGLLPKLDRFRDSIEEYCYTDISKAFLLQAADRYTHTHPWLTTRLFDVTRPIAVQGIEPGRYDVALATNVLHATPDIRWALRNTKAAMRRHGLLVLNELSAASLFTHLTFGLLPGWWLYEDASLRIPGCPGLYPERWATLLGDEGFRSIMFPAEDAHGAGQQIIVAESDGVVRQSTAAPVPSVALPPPPARTSNEASPSTRVTERMLEDHVKSTIRESVSDVLRMEEASIRNDRSFSDYGVDSIVGVQLIRQVGEAYGIALPTMVIFDHNNVNDLTRYLLNEYSGRVRESMGIQASHLTPAVLEQYPPADVTPSAPARTSSGTFLHVVIERPGEIDGLRTVEGTPPALSDGEIRVSVRAFALNYADLLCVRGLYPNMPPYPFTPGLEASGIVVEVGCGVKSLRPGDAVIVDNCRRMGTQASMVICPEDDAVRKPDELSFEQACVLPIATLTMLDAFDRANLRAGERVLIQTAAGGTGLAAVQLAQSRGAEIYATAGSPEKLDYLATLGVRHLINYRENDFEIEIRRLCEGRGMDVVINTLPGEFIQKGLRCLAPGGRYVELAMMALKSARNIDLSMLSCNQSFIGVDLPGIARENPGRIRELRAEMMRLQKAGALSSAICRVFPFDKLEEAYRFLDTRRNIGKIVVQIPEAMQYCASLPETTFAPVRSTTPRVAADEPIAVIGMSGRFARSDNLEQFWKHLADGTDLVERVSRWDIPDTTTDADAPGGSRKQCTHGSFLDGIDLFDPLFFDISGMEAACMDPQQRVLLEEAWKALEDAGYAGEQIHGQNCGVYIGCTAGDYSKLLQRDRPAQAFWGNHGSVIPARISYFLNLRGPAIAVDTACSSSLVATHLACQALRAGETDMALAGGVFIQSTPEFYELANKAGMLSPTGRCHTFDTRADGFVPGEAAAAVVLKRLRDAIADGDHICGVIRGSATNQDGRSNGITAPSAKSQEFLERQVYDRFQIDPETIQLIEAHGTGTDLGDPIEFEGLNRAFRHYTQQQGFCAIGSVKTNIGHAAMAAGIAGVIKLLLSLKHRQIPPSLHFESQNPKVPLNGSPFYVNTQLRPWEASPDGMRRAAISSFGFSGTNVHMVIESAPSINRRHLQNPAYLIVLSAQSSSQLRQHAANIAAFCESNPGIDLGNMSFTLLVGRRHCAHRLAVVSARLEELCASLHKWLKRGTSLQVLTGEPGNADQHEDPGLKRHGNQCIESVAAASSDTLKLENLSTVAELFVRGYRLDYHRLYGDGYSRISLPVYPFAKEHYWAPGGQSENQAARPLPSSRSDRWLFIEEAWRSVPLPEDLDWNERFRQCAGMSIFVVSADDSDRKEMISLLNLLTEAAGCPEPLKLRSIAPSDIAPSDNRGTACPEPPDVVFVIGPQNDTSPASDVFRLSQWLMRHGWDAPIRLYYIYEGSDSRPMPGCEALSGFMTSAMHENERHVWTLIEALDEHPASTQHQLLLKEWLCDGPARGATSSRQSSFREIRYASSERLVRQLRETTLLPPSTTLFRADRTYVVTGGLGPVGYLLCEEIARRHHSTLVILSRGELDEARQQQCRRLESLGSAVHYYPVDITDRSALRETWTRIKSKVATIHGVIHLARLVEDGLIIAKTRESFEHVCAAKTDGTRNLDEITASEPLEFFALFSSMAAVGIRGSADYGYSSAFQNAFARHRNRLKSAGERAGHTVSLCWGAWTVDKYKPKDRDEKLKAAGYGLIGIDEALPYLEAACSSDRSMVGLMAVDDLTRLRATLGLETPADPTLRHGSDDRLTQLVEEWERQKATGAVELVPPIDEVVSERELKRMDPTLVDRLHELLFGDEQAAPPPIPDTPDIDLRQTVTEVISEILRLGHVDENRTFQGYGLDSISATRIAVRLERRLNRPVHPHWLVDYPTVARLTEHLAGVSRESQH